MPKAKKNLFEQEAERERRRREERRKQDANEEMMAIYIQEELRKKKEKETEEGYKQGKKTGEAIAYAGINLFTGEPVEEREKEEEKEESEIEEKLYERDGNKLSVKELLDELSGQEDSGSAFYKLHDKLKDHPTGEKAADALEEFIRDARAEIMAEVKAEMERRQKAEERGEPEDESKAQAFEHKLAVKMTIMKRVMKSGDFNRFCRDLDGLGMAIDPGALNGLTFWDIQKKKLSATLTRLKEMKGGQPKGFFQMMSGLSPLLGKKEEPERAEKERTAAALADFVLNDCAPTKQGVDQDAFKTAMFGVKILVSEQQFKNFVDRVNAQPGRRIKFKPEDFNELPERKLEDKDLQKEQEAPVLRRHEEWEN